MAGLDETLAEVSGDASGRPEASAAAGVPAPVGATSAAAVPAANARRLWARRTALNWRLFLVRVVASGLAVILTVLLVPGLGFTGWQPGQFGVVTLTYAVLVAVLKPLLEFLALRFLVATYGLVVILINATVLFALAQLLPELLVYDRLWQLLLGGVVVGALGLVLETVLGATPPVLDTRARS
jgi:putative membrane protein